LLAALTAADHVSMPGLVAAAAAAAGVLPPPPAAVAAAATTAVMPPPGGALLRVEEVTERRHVHGHERAVWGSFGFFVRVVWGMFGQTGFCRTL